MKTRYWYLIVIPSLFFVFGGFLNQLAIFANHGHMPVSWPGGCALYPKDKDDPVHVCMTKESHLRIISDWIKSSGEISSPGDLIMDASQAFFQPFLILWLVLKFKDYTKENDSIRAP